METKGFLWWLWGFWNHHKCLSWLFSFHLNIYGHFIVDRVLFSLKIGISHDFPRNLRIVTHVIQLARITYYVGTIEIDFTVCKLSGFKFCSILVWADLKHVIGWGGYLDQSHAKDPGRTIARRILDLCPVSPTDFIPKFKARVSLKRSDCLFETWSRVVI